ncbi:site-specific integrase [Ketobacter sp. MCCC 1A13808]|uniref:tyrosine-type recombinase/integrase n=1 Tax=Ketobacter sp. MCCC 1A13808 TaxID=2602738 RepID=UPI0012EC0876|nr:site-specific integrase [Ketobacter sp. MCCC 1A13808]MVF14808.1 site-specific integrase [Ketobacter sp. MCCC 1A13808]
MSLPVPTQNTLTALASAEPPLRIDWHYWQKRRPLVLNLNPEVPPYLVLPEVHQVLACALHQELHCLLNLLWHSGARITEALSLTREDIELNGERDSLLILANLKRKPGRPGKQTASRPKRMVPLTDGVFIEELRRTLATRAPRKGEPVFSFNRQQVHYQLEKIEQTLKDSGQPLPIKRLSAHTFRHSFAVNCLLQGRDIRTIQGWLGHANLASTEIYLQVLSGETHHLAYGLQF